MSRIIIYSVLPRLWGNFTEQPKANGTMNENGSGRLSSWDANALNYIRKLGCTHIWFIGLLEHATTTAFTSIPADPEEIVKGKAGSPYAIRDYYDIAPALADNIAYRQQEFDALVDRVHQAGLRMMIDFVPNHVARTYRSDCLPQGEIDLGQDDDPRVAFARDNTFYYLPGSSLSLPHGGHYTESPARATGNDCFTAQPGLYDWYETVKLNYGVDYSAGGKQHFSPIPSTWLRMYAILDHWASRGVDGFRCDMVEMVPPEFWAWTLPQLKSKYPHLICLAEVYNPCRYREYIVAGFDYLYDKVGAYDTLRAVVRGEQHPFHFETVRSAPAECLPHMCYFLENHDEQRFASDFFAGERQEAIFPALAVMVLCSNNAYLHYFAGELGELGMDSEGFSGRDGRTSIFDYWALDSLKRLGPDFQGTRLLPREQRLLSYHQTIFHLASSEVLVSLPYTYSLKLQLLCQAINAQVCGYLRYNGEGRCVLILANFGDSPDDLQIHFSQDLLLSLGIPENTPLKGRDLLVERAFISTLTPLAPLEASLAPYGVLIHSLETIPE